VFEEVLKFYMTISEVETRTLWLSVWHSDIFGRNDFLGEVTLPLGHEVFETPGLKWYPLQERVCIDLRKFFFNYKLKSSENKLM
jgi:synaptotagmin-like protein